MRSSTLCRRYFARLHNVDGNLENVLVRHMVNGAAGGWKGGHRGGSANSYLAPYAHWVGFVYMGVPQVPPGHPKQGGNDRYRSITHDPVVADQ